jgi:uncharacterized membrane protein (DUF485 family)
MSDADAEIVNSLSGVDRDVTLGFYRQPTFRETLEREFVAFAELIFLIIYVPVVAMIGVGLSWLLGWIRPNTNWLLLSVLGVAIFVPWFILMRRAGHTLSLRSRERENLQPLLDRDIKKVTKLNEQFLARHIKGGEPFGLFLRSFYIDAVTAFGRTPGRPWAASSLYSPSPVEAGLARSLKDRIQVFGVANFASGTSGSIAGLGLPKITLPDENWRKVLDRLIDRAGFIVVDATEMTAGLVDELLMIDAQERRECTVVITPSGKDHKRIAWRDRELAHMGPSYIIRNTVDTSQAIRILAKFPRVVAYDQIDFSRLESVPAFTGLLPEHPNRTRPRPANQPHN